MEIVVVIKDLAALIVQKHAFRMPQVTWAALLIEEEELAAMEHVLVFPNGPGLVAKFLLNLSLLNPIPKVFNQLVRLC
jgi:hypothetical protein